MPFFQGVILKCAVCCALVVPVACHGHPDERVSTARLDGSEGIAYGDCAEARKRAAEKPDLAVDRIPTVVRQSPRPFQRMPASVKRRVDSRGAVVKVDVVVDTLGRPDMRTFKVVESTPDAWLAANVKAVMPKWKFAPAELAGCKVARVFKFSATTRPRG